MESWAARVSSSATAKRSVAVRILGHDYRIRTEADPEAVERVARLVHDTMDRIRVRTGTVDTLDLAILAALNLANDLVALQEEAPGRPPAGATPERLRQVIDRVEAVLRDAG